jgi:hypothetical protein
MCFKLSSVMEILALLFFCAWTSYALPDARLQYQDRGNRHEGIRPKPVSGYDIELISVRVDYKEESEQMPDHLAGVVLGGAGRLGHVLAGCAPGRAARGVWAHPVLGSVEKSVGFSYTHTPASI